MKFEYYIDRKGEYRWRLRAKNGKIIADSAEGYTRKRNMLIALAMVRGDMARELLNSAVKEVKK